ncbi:MAG: acyl carrier protein [Candidatus Nealsonbacteria bacterium]|nr:acyl carrier protein [Candidatus Nealsonbacteria bacterium]
MRDDIRNYLLSHSATAGVADLADNESLLDAGVIDSAAMIDLIVFLEKGCRITIDEDDMIPENFDSVDAIVAYVDGKRNGSAV